MKKIICCLLLLTGLSAGFAYSASWLRGLEKVDLIKVSAFLEDYELSVQPSYVNRDEDRFVEWYGRTITCRYKVFSLKKDNFEKDFIITKGMKTLKRWDQDFYVKISKRFIKKEAWAKIECEFRIQRLTFKASDIFSLRPYD